MDEWLNLLSGKDLIIPALAYKSVDYGSYKALTFSTKLGGEPSENIIFATLPVNRIVSLVTDEEIAEYGNIRMYNERGELLFNGGVEISEGFRVITGRSGISRIRFEIAVPDLIIKQRMRPFTNLLIIFVAAATVGIFLLAMFFAWQNSKPLQSLLDTLDSTTAIRSEYERIKYNERFNPFRSFKQLFNIIGQSISHADKKLENSFRTIKTKHPCSGNERLG
jgi:hypothetical protein